MNRERRIVSKKWSCFFWVATALCQSVVGSAGAQTGAQQVVGARAAALGEAYIALADDGYAVYWNPAGLPQLRRQQVNAGRADLFGTGLESNYLSWAVPVRDGLAFGVDWLRLSFGDDELNLSQCCSLFWPRIGACWRSAARWHWFCSFCWFWPSS